MNNFLNKRVLILSNHNLSLGDGFTAYIIFHYILMKFNNQVIIHFGCTDYTCETLSWLNHTFKFVDKTFIHDKTGRYGDYLYNRFSKLKDSYDYIILWTFYSSDHLDFEKEVVDFFGRERLYHAQEEHARMFNIPYLFDIPGFKLEDVNSIKFEDNAQLQINSILSLSGNKKRLILYPTSTRWHACINPEGIHNIYMKYKDMYQIYIAGELYDLYSPASNVNHKTVFEKSIDSIVCIDNDDIVNIMGLSIDKMISICNSSDLIIMAPTGINLLSYSNLIHTKTLVFLGGETEIMDGIYKHGFLKKYDNNVEMMPCNCPYYPCFYNHNKNIAKVDTCRDNKHPICLNEEINI